MNTSQQSEVVSFALTAGAVAEVKARLQQTYEEAYPQLAEIIHLVIDEEEANARELSFPQLFLPDLVAAHIQKLNLEPVSASRRVSSSHRFGGGRLPVTEAPALRTAGFDTELRAA